MYTRNARVTTSCTDETCTQTLVSAVTMMQDTSMLWLESQPVMSAWLDEDDVIMMVASREVEIRRRPRYGENLTVSTWIYKMQSLMGFRNTCIFDESGQATASCWCTGVFVSRTSGSVVRVPDYVLEATKIEPAFDMAYGKRKIKLPHVAPRELPAMQAQRTDIDLNGHVNNAQYVRMAYECLPEGFEPTHMRIVHEGQAKRGDAIRIALYETPGAGDAATGAAALAASAAAADAADAADAPATYTFALTGDAGQTFALIEFK